MRPTGLAQLRVLHSVTPLAIICATLAACLLGFAADNAQADDIDTEIERDSSRWREYSFGLSLIPPPASFVRQPPPTHAAERFYLSNGSAIQIALEKSLGLEDPAAQRLSSFGVQGATRIESGDEHIETAETSTRMFVQLGDGLTSVAEVMQFTVQQVAAVDPKAVVIDQRDEINLQGHDAAIIYFRIPAGREPQWTLGLGIMQIDPRHFAVLRLESTPQTFDADRPVFEKVFHSIRVEPREELHAWRNDLLSQGDKWLRTITPEKLIEAAKTEQWFRIVDGKRDVGWIRMEQRPEEYLAEPGLAVHIRSRIFTTVRNPRSQNDVGAPPMIEKAHDSENFFFLNEKRDSEVWTIHSTLRPANKPLPNLANAPPRADRANPINASTDQAFSQWEQGAASGPTISVTRGDQRVRWLRPEIAYLSQVESFLLGSLFPREDQAQYGFYAYHPQTGRIAFRTVRTTIDSEGNLELHVRPTPDAREDIYRYAADGSLQSWRLPSGRAVLASSPNEIKRIWRSQ